MPAALETRHTSHQGGCAAVWRRLRNGWPWVSCWRDVRAIRSIRVVRVAFRFRQQRQQIVVRLPATTLPTHVHSAGAAAAGGGCIGSDVRGRVARGAVSPAAQTGRKCIRAWRPIVSYTLATGPAPRHGPCATGPACSCRRAGSRALTRYCPARQQTCRPGAWHIWVPSAAGRSA